jgi:hypothetical protein
LIADCIFAVRQATALQLGCCCTPAEFPSGNESKNDGWLRRQPFNQAQHLANALAPSEFPIDNKVLLAVFPLPRLRRVGPPSLTLALFYVIYPASPTTYFDYSPR